MADLQAIERITAIAVILLHQEVLAAALQASLDRYGPAVVAALVEAVDYFGRCLRDSFAKQMEEKENDDNP